MRKKMIGTAAGIAVLGITTGIAVAGPGSAPVSRLDDGKALLSQAKITEQQAIAAAQDAANGDLNEIDLESYRGRLVFNVDIGDREAKVDASDGTVLAVPPAE